MFDFERSIQQWLKAFNKHRAFDEASRMEMELHLRDHIEDLVRDGLNEQEAFERATVAFGAIQPIAKEEYLNQKRKRFVLTSFMYTTMLKSFYFSAIRNLLKHRGYFLINIIGLAIGIASFLFISSYVWNEMSYDRFHHESEHTYRVSSEAIIRGEPNYDALTAAPFAKTIKAKYPEIKKATRVLRNGSVLIGREGNKFDEEGMLFSDSEFFEIFDFKLIMGDPVTVLDHPRSLVLTESFAVKYFGKEDPIGKQLTVEEDSIFYTVTGVVEDIPTNSHIQFDLLGSIHSKKSWNTNRWVTVGMQNHTYVVLDPMSDVEALQERMKEVFYDHVAPEVEFYTGLTIDEWEGAGNSISYKLTPIRAIHLHSIYNAELEATGNIKYIYIYVLIAIAILFVAIFNFVNLATAHSSTRAKEVGIRKVIGSTKRTLILQFISESVLVALMATAFAVLLFYAFMPAFKALIGKALVIPLIDNYLGWISLFGLAIFIGVLAGSYPSFVLSGFRPIEAIKGTFQKKGHIGWLRNLLVTAQFAASIIIIIGTLVVYHQIDHMLTKNLGFNKDQILIIKRPDWLNTNLEVFKNELLEKSDVKLVTNTETIPGKPYGIRSYRKKDDTETFLFLNNQVNYEYLTTMGMELVSGRFFSKAFGADSNAVIINESAAARFGYTKPIGKTLTSAFKKGRPLRIIGVIKDYHIESLHKAIVPLSLELDPDSDGFLCVKLNKSENIRMTLGYIQDVWRKYSNDKPFQYFFFDEDYQTLYKSEVTTGRLLSVFASLSIFIACMGLIGLITYTAAIRKKEIGIRKVLGANMATLIKLFGVEVLQLILLATLVAWPLAYLGTNYWLQNFTDRIPANPWIYIGATLTVIFIVALSISYQTLKAIFSNPVDSLRDE